MSPGNGCSGCRAVTKFAGVWGRKQSLPLVWFFFILMTGVDYSKVYLFYTLMHSVRVKMGDVIFPVGKRACCYLWRWISAELLFSLLLNFSEIKENKQMLFQKRAFVIMLPVWPWFVPIMVYYTNKSLLKWIPSTLSELWNWKYVTVLPLCFVLINRRLFDCLICERRGETETTRLCDLEREVCAPVRPDRRGVVEDTHTEVDGDGDGASF